MPGGSREDLVLKYRAVRAQCKDSPHDLHMLVYLGVMRLAQFIVVLSCATLWWHFFAGIL